MSTSRPVAKSRHRKVVEFLVVFGLVACLGALVESTARGPGGWMHWASSFLEPVELQRPVSAANHRNEVERLSTLLTTDPDNLSYLADRAWSYGQLGERERQIADLDAALALRAENPAPLYNNRADALAQLGRYDEAMLDAEKALEMAPEVAHVLDTMGYILVGLKQHQRAIKVYDKALALQPSKIHSLWGRGMALRAVGDEKAAQADFAQARQIDPDFRLDWPAATKALIR